MGMRSDLSLSRVISHGHTTAALSSVKSSYDVARPASSGDTGDGSGS